MTRYKTIRASCLLAGALLFSATAFADDGKVEVAGFGGGISVDNGGGTHPLVGGSVGVRVVDHLHVFGEFSVVPLASASLYDSGSGVSASGTDRLYHFGGGVDYGFGSSKRVVPYVVLAAGLGRQVTSATFAVAGVSASESAGSNSVYFAGGGGVRFYVGDKWGFKPELRVHHYIGTGGSSSTAIAYTFGVFFQFGQ